MTAGLLAGRRALLTGAASGIGAATARRFCEQGAAVVLTDLDGAGAEEQARSLRAEGLRAHAAPLDVTDDRAVARALADAARTLGGLDTVLANAGVLSLGCVEETPVEQVERLLHVNVLGAYSVLRHAIPHVRAAGQGVLLATASLAGLQGSAELAAYAASKFAVVGLVQSLAGELAPEGIRVCAVAPGFVGTAMLEPFAQARAAIRGCTRAEVVAAMLAATPIGRLVAPEEVADAFVYLASPLAAAVTGETLTVSGGAA